MGKRENRQFVSFVAGMCVLAGFFLMFSGDFKKWLFETLGITNEYPPFLIGIVFIGLGYFLFTYVSKRV